ncbi:PD-(D/E)XK nuclease family protein [Aeromonas salmonicida]|nr:PD-(D/E)XK nuclease family protein [Aeromonas salmonicida]
MKLELLRSLLDELSMVPTPVKREPNLFSIGARGHYENPISDLLAFFLCPNADHNLDSLVLETLLECLPEGAQLSASLINDPQREVTTHTNSRLDLLLESEEWVMALENKIWHHQNNPFSDYEAFLAKHYRDKPKLLLVLSPSGKSPIGWYGVAYHDFLNRLSPKLGQAFVTTPFNKWLILLREFLLHLESLMAVSDIPTPTTNFVLSHLNEIQKIQDMKNSVVRDLQTQCVRYLEQHFSEQELNVSTKINTWYGYPALRFGFKHWVSDSDVVLFLDGREGHRFAVNYYACDLKGDIQHQAAYEALYQVECSEQWQERANTVACFKLLLNDITPEAMFVEVARHLAMLDIFESKIRSKWA